MRPLILCKGSGDASELHKTLLAWATLLLPVDSSRASIGCMKYVVSLVSTFPVQPRRNRASPCLDRFLVQRPKHLVYRSMNQVQILCTRHPVPERQYPVSASNVSFAVNLSGKVQLSAHPLLHAPGYPSGTKQKVFRGRKKCLSCCCHLLTR